MRSWSGGNTGATRNELYANTLRRTGHTAVLVPIPGGEGTEIIITAQRLGEYGPKYVFPGLGGSSVSGFNDALVYHVFVCDFEFRENQEESGKEMRSESTFKESYYLDRAFFKSSSEVGESGLLGIDAEAESKSGVYVYYEESLESDSGSASATPGFMHSLYKIFLLVLLLRITLFFGENTMGRMDHVNLLLFIVMMVMALVFIFGFTNSYIMDNGDRVILENNAKNEPDVNMTLIIGYGTIVDEETHVVYGGTLGDTQKRVMWYPSWGFILFFASALLTFSSREDS